jgi:hypothetical protein
VKDPTRPGLLRRLAAIFYDSLLLFARALGQGKEPAPVAGEPVAPEAESLL